MFIRAALVVLLAAVPMAAQKPRAASVAGRVIHTDGSAAAQAKVVVYSVVEDAPGAVLATGISSHDGRYQIENLPAGPVYVAVTGGRAGGFGGDTKRLAMPIETFYPGVVERHRAEPVMLFEHVPAEGIDVWLAPAPQRFSISGSVFAPPGVDLDKVVIEYGGPRSVRHGVWHVNDARGDFTIEGVGPETYVLLARVDTPAGPLIGVASTTIAGGSVEDVRVVLRQPGTIEGQVMVEGTGKTTVGDLRVRPEQLLLTLSPLYPSAETTPDASGRFEIRNVVGEYTLDVAGLPPGWRVRRVRLKGQPLPSDRIVVPAGERVTGVEVVIGVGTT